MGKITAPEVINENHDISDFDCGEESLNEWLKNRAIKNNSSNASRCFVICNENKVIGYYAFSAGQVDNKSAPGKIKRNMPNPIPVFILGRLAIDLRYQNMKLGSALLKDCMFRAIAVSEHMAGKALLVHALSQEAKDFYLKYGFQNSIINPMTLFLSIDDIKRHVKE